MTMYPPMTSFASEYGPSVTETPLPLRRTTRPSLSRSLLPLPAMPSIQVRYFFMIACSSSGLRLSGFQLASRSTIRYWDIVGSPFFTLQTNGERGNRHARGGQVFQPAAGGGRLEKGERASRPPPGGG